MESEEFVYPATAEEWWFLLLDCWPDIEVILEPIMSEEEVNMVKTLDSNLPRALKNMYLKLPVSRYNETKIGWYELVDLVNNIDLVLEDTPVNKELLKKER